MNSIEEERTHTRKMVMENPITHSYEEANDMVMKMGFSISSEFSKENFIAVKALYSLLGVEGSKRQVRNIGISIANRGGFTALQAVYYILRSYCFDEYLIGFLCDISQAWNGLDGWMD